MKYLVVFDTNVFVSHFLTPTKTTAVNVIIARVLEQKVIPVYSDATMSEYQEVLGRRKFHFRQDAIFSFLKLIHDTGHYVIPRPTPVYFTDYSDKPFYEAAVSSGAWLVTGNKRHYPDESFIVSPREYIERAGM